MSTQVKDKKDTAALLTPSSSQIGSFRTIVLVLFPLFSVAGFLGTWILASRNGTVKMLEALAQQDGALFPGTTELILKTYTGIEHIDRQLTILVTFFAPVVDSKNGALLLSSTFGLGQFGAAWMLMQLESMRMGNLGRIVSFVGTFGFLIQNITFTVTVPWWLFIHVLTSPAAEAFPGSHASSVLLVSSLNLKILPFSIILGYLVPSILMSLPSPEIASPFAHQKYIALWQPFPVWCVIIQTLVRYICSMIGVTDKNTNNRPPTALANAYLNSAKYVYSFIIGLCMFTHLLPLVLALLGSSNFPDSMPILQNLAQHDFASIYIPYFPSLTTQVSSLAAGVHAFLQWDLYIGCASMLLWGVFLHQNATIGSLTNGTSWGSLLGKIGFWTALAGPTGALAVLLWERDTIVRQKVKQAI